eukprot:Nitzschia sp. Nitz4//scaffold341_size29662//25421//26365//NITZ4_008043-RA/size29662-processed-gene-0.23-mRNA-1//1//CDS//3329548561//3251//frame0
MATVSTLSDELARCCSDFEEVHDILEVMRRKESEYQLDFRPNELEALWRKILIDWMAFVIDHCFLQKQAVAAAAFFLDVAMSKGLLETREEHQLAAASALQLSLKLFDSTVIRIEKLVKLGRGVFTKEDVARMEYNILESLNWHCHPPSTYCFLQQYERLLPSTVSEPTRQMINEATKLVTELTVADHRYSTYNTSEVAYATMLLAMELLDSHDLPVPQRHCFVLNMSAVSNIRSNSPSVLKIFELLKGTLDSSSKLEPLLKSLATVSNTNRSSPIPGAKGMGSTSSALQSPRHVMERLASSRSSSASNSPQMH